MDRLIRLLLACVVLLSAGQVLAETAVEDFSFIQVTDIHLSPYLERAESPPAWRGAETLAWICTEAVGPQKMDVLDLAAPAPAFGLATGDLTEYGVIDGTWGEFERAFAPLPYPLYVLPGNHDNTWVALYQVMRARYGGENYSFDKFGCHFACISSASPQEPVPTIDAKTRTWLKRDLDGIASGTPVFLALHHPPDSGEFAPAEYDTLIDFLKDYNVVLVLYGHGHGVSQRKLDGIDGVMGGSTFGGNAGYMLISVTDGVLRAAYRYHHPPEGAGASADGWKLLLEKQISSAAPRRAFRIVEPALGARVGARFEVLCEYAEGDSLAAPGEWKTCIDGVEVGHETTSDGPGVMRIDAEQLTPGRHMLSVRLETQGGGSDLRTVAFQTEREVEREIWRREFPGAFKAGPVVVEQRLIIAGNDGVVRALDRETGGTLWAFETGGEILGTPAAAGGILAFGSGDGHVYALNMEGRLIWKHDAKAPVYGEPLIDGEVVYIGDNGGLLHALDLRSGQTRWTFARADYAIELKPCVWGELIVFGAWDGYLYAVNRADGVLAWKVWGPKSSEGKAARYYAPADCGPIVVGDKLYVCDRGYLLGAYNRDGAAAGVLDQKVSAIAGDAGDAAFYCRKTDDRVCKYTAAGELAWEREIDAGRFPIPPTVVSGLAYVCSNRGLLSVLKLDEGAILWQYQTTPGFYVMAPVAADERGTCYIAGMDGTVTALRGELE